MVSNSAAIAAVRAPRSPSKNRRTAVPHTSAAGITAMGASTGMQSVRPWHSIAT